jgi:hypothetical protein
VAEGDEASAVPPAKKPKKGQTESSANGKVNSKGKGKAKAEPPQKTSRRTVEPIEVDDVEVTEGTEVEKPTARATAKSKKPVSNTARTKSSDLELNRLRQKLAEVRGFCHP